jgi:hypothetical protein
MTIVRHPTAGSERQSGSTLLPFRCGLSARKPPGQRRQPSIRRRLRASRHSLPPSPGRGSSRRHARPRRVFSARCRTSTPRSTSVEVMPLSSCFEKSCAGPQAMAGRKPPERYWHSFGDALPPGAEAMHEPFAAFPSWLMRIRCDRCGKDRFLVETHFDRRDMLLRDHQAHAPRCLWRPGW